MTLSDDDTIEFLGIAFSEWDVDRALAWISAAANGDRFTFVVTPNVDHLVTYHNPAGTHWHQAYCVAVQACDLCLNDSRILQRLSRLSGERLPIAPGSDVVRRVVEARRDVTGSIALVGGSTREASWLAEAMPHHRIHHFEPPMGVRDDPGLQRKIVRFVEESAADIVFIAIGAPQSEIVAHAIARRDTARGVALCIGASIEFLSGAKRRAPRWMQRAGIEWLFRLASEPSRLWRRYLVDGPLIFHIWGKAVVRRAQRGTSS